jgi:hypothetical protein
MFGWMCCWYHRIASIYSLYRTGFVKKMLLEEYKNVSKEIKESKGRGGKLRTI